MTTTNTTAFSVSTDDIISAALRQLGRLGAGATPISSITVPPTISFISDGANLFEIRRGF